MSQEVYRDLIKRHGAKKADRTTVEVMWEAIERFVTPYRGRFFYDQRSEHSIDWFNSRDIYDSTPVMAHRNLSASIHGSLTSPTLRWFDLRFRNEELNGDKGSVGWLQDAADAVHYELQDSNWDLEINKAYQDVCGFGTTALVLEEGPGRADWGGLEFISVPLKEVYFELGYDGQAVRFFREIEWTPQQIMTKFGDDVPGKVKELEKAGSDAKLKVLYCIYPRNNKIMKWGEKVAPSRRPWASCYLLLECDDDDRKLGKSEGGYYEMPAFIGRWAATNSSVWGNSPAMDALGDVLTLNQVVKDVIRARAKQIDPPILAEERSIITDLNLDPATISVVRSVKGVVPFLTGGQVMTADAEIDRLQANIRSYFMVDRIDFPDMQPQPMTATEAQIRYERMQRYMGATLAQLRVELLNPVVERTFNMMVRKGLIPKPPEKVTKAGGIYEVEYLGSLTRAQQVDEVTAIERTMMTAGSLAEVFPDALDVIDAPKAIRMIGRKLNAPATIMRDEKEVKAKQKEREDKREAMEANALMQAEGEAMQAQGEGQNAMGGEVEGAQSPA
jgi:hypothetical protein